MNPRIVTLKSVVGDLFPFEFRGRISGYRYTAYTAGFCGNNMCSGVLFTNVDSHYFIHLEDCDRFLINSIDIDKYLESDVDHESDCYKAVKLLRAIWRE